jgi:hypothetical protein
MDPASRKRFGIRSTGERGNAHLKDWLLAVKILQHLILPSVAEAA